MLAHHNQQEVLVVRMPEDKDEKKAFLGYEWSSTKGNEGIKYLNQSNSDEDDSLAKRKGIERIQTPLFNPQNLFDDTKINSLIRQNFNQQAINIPESLSNYVSLLPLSKMLDFSRAAFDKVIHTKLQKKLIITSKYPVITLETFPAEIRKGKSITKKNSVAGNYKVIAGGKEFAYTHNEFNRDENTITISASGANAGFVNFWAEKIFASDCTTVRANNDVSTKYIFAYLQNIQESIFDLARGAAQPHVYPDDIKRLPIPQPPLDIQQKIVEEHKKINDEFNQTRMQIEEYRAKIAKLFNELEIVLEEKIEG